MSRDRSLQLSKRLSAVAAHLVVKEMCLSVWGKEHSFIKMSSSVQHTILPICKWILM